MYGCYVWNWGKIIILWQYYVSLDYYVPIFIRKYIRGGQNCPNKSTQHKQINPNLIWNLKTNWVESGHRVNFNWKTRFPSCINRFWVYNIIIFWIRTWLNSNQPESTQNYNNTLSYIFRHLYNLSNMNQPKNPKIWVKFLFNWNRI